MTYIFFKTNQIYLIVVVPKLLSTIDTNILPKFFKVTILFINVGWCNCALIGLLRVCRSTPDELKKGFMHITLILPNLRELAVFI